MFPQAQGTCVISVSFFLPQRTQRRHKVHKENNNLFENDIANKVIGVAIDDIAYWALAYWNQHTKNVYIIK
jgi:hypothetical protein